MPRGLSTKPRAEERLMHLMMTGQPVTLDEIESKIGNEIYMYRISAYILAIKNLGGVTRPHREGRKVVAYQLMNPEKCKEHFKKRGFTDKDFEPSGKQLKPTVAKIAAQKDKNRKKKVDSLDELKTEQVSQQEDFEIVEITQ